MWASQWVCSSEYIKGEKRSRFDSEVRGWNHRGLGARLTPTSKIIVSQVSLSNGKFLKPEITPGGRAPVKTILGESLQLVQLNRAWRSTTIRVVDAELAHDTLEDDARARLSLFASARRSRT